MFSCCDDFAAGDKDLAYDCKTSLPGGGICTDEASCKENYKKGMEIITDARLKALFEKEPTALTISMETLIVLILVFGIYIPILINECRKRRKRDAERKKNKEA